MDKAQRRALRDDIKRQRADRIRALRIVRSLDFNSILDDSPVEVNEGYIVADRDNCDIFLSLIFKNVGDLPIKRLSVRVDFYLNQNIPYLKLPFVYSAEHLTFGIIGDGLGNDLKLKESNRRKTVGKGECFGSCVYIPLPETYFTRLELVLDEAEFGSGEVKKLDIPVREGSKRYSDLDALSRLAYTRANVFQVSESLHPTVVMPTEGKTAWLCCCGNKNTVDAKVCRRCGREKEWQMQALTAEAVEHTVQELRSDPTNNTFHDKSRFRQDKMMATRREIEEKEAQYQKAMENIAAEERRRERRDNRLIPKILIIAAFVALITLILWIIQEGGIVIFPWAT